MPGEGRGIPRPRPTLNCLACRQRKVRCSKERPACTNCVRVSAVCKYGGTALDYARDTPSNAKRRRAVEDESPSPDKKRSLSPMTGSSRAQPIDLVQKLGDLDGLNGKLQPHSKQTPNAQPLELNSSLPGQDQQLRDDSIGANVALDATDMARSEFDDKIAITHGYLSKQLGGQFSYVENSFWALIRGYEPLCEELLRKPLPRVDGVPEVLVNSHGLIHLFKHLPTRSACDALVSSFLAGVHPLCPLMHVPTFQKDCDSFWFWYIDFEDAFVSPKLFDDPTFICLLFSVIYCGAVVIAPELWSDDAMQGISRDVLLATLRDACSSSLEYCQHLKYPTQSTLTASLLHYFVSEMPVNTEEATEFVGTVVRIAQKLGMHRNGTKLGLDPISSAARHRIWWHIVCLDVETNTFAGRPMSSPSLEAFEDSHPFIERGNENSFGPMSADSLGSATDSSSASGLLTFARYETARFKRLIIEHPCAVGVTSNDRRKDIAAAERKFHAMIDSVLARFPDEARTETDITSSFTPVCLRKCTPLTHEQLYSDSLDKQNVFSCFARIVLCMLKLEATILVKKIFLNREDRKNAEGQTRWSSAFSLCLEYLEMFLQLGLPPSFKPFRWFQSTLYPPLELSLLILIHLLSEQDIKATDAERAVLCVDSVLFFFKSEIPSTRPRSREKPDEDRNGSKLEHVLNVLESLYKRVRQRRHKPNHEARDPNASNHQVTNGEERHPENPRNASETVHSDNGIPKTLVEQAMSHGAQPATGTTPPYLAITSRPLGYAKTGHSWDGGNI